jgi:hypothetical protein
MRARPSQGGGAGRESETIVIVLAASEKHVLPLYRFIWLTCPALRPTYRLVEKFFEGKRKSISFLSIKAVINDGRQKMREPCMQPKQKRIRACIGQTQLMERDNSLLSKNNPNQNTY